MIVRRIGAAGTPPVALGETKDHLRVTNDLEDGVISALIAAACDAVGEECGRVLASETWELADTGFSGDVLLPKSPVVALTSVKYYLDGVLTTDTIGNYRLYSGDDYTSVGPIEGASWPMAQTRPDGTIIRFTTGYTTLPASLRHAVLLMVGHFYTNREATGEAIVELPLAVKHLVGMYRLGWVGA